MEHIHFIGIGGTGLSAIAKVLLEQGVRVSGSDLNDSPLFAAVREAGGSVSLGHHAENIRGADLVVRSSAIPDNNPEVLAARKAGIPVLKRSDFLDRLTAGKKVLAVAGSHGKTTTTSMLTWILTKLGKDPSFIVGGVVANLETNARAGKGNLFVIEADEYDYMFLGLHPRLAVITNVEHDHPDIFPTVEIFEEAFRKFVSNLQSDGTLIVCAESPAALRLGQQLKDGQTLVRYGFQESTGEFTAENLRVNHGGGMDFDLVIGSEGQADHLSVSLRVPGRHNVLNALGAFAAAELLGLPREEVISALAEFKGSGRRFEIRGEWAGVMLVDDYGHHPTEIAAALAAARAAYPERFIRAVWQPHTYSRTSAFFGEFAVAFEDANQVIVLGVYEAREKIPVGFSIEGLVQSIEHKDTHFIPDIEQAAVYLENEVKQGDLVLVFSAGDAIEINDRLEHTLSDRSS